MNEAVFSLLGRVGVPDIIQKELKEEMDSQKSIDDIVEKYHYKISPLFPVYDRVASILYLFFKVYKGRLEAYPPFEVFVSEMVEKGFYDDEVIATFSKEELEELGDYIKPERDLNFSFWGITTFMLMNSLGGLELPQQAIMRVAMFAFWKEEKRRLEYIKRRYDYLSKAFHSEASPRWFSSLTKEPMMASCILVSPKDDAYSINRSIHSVGIYNRYGGGASWDSTLIRSIGSKLGRSGRAGGKIPFIRMLETTTKAYNQRGKRTGQCNVYFSWWDWEVLDLLQLNEEGGVEDRRARGLKLTIKLDGLFFDKLRKGEDVYLFDPADVTDLAFAYGEEFNRLYKHHSNRKDIRKKRININQLAYEIAFTRNESELYIFFTDNANSQTPFKTFINSANLCCEVMLPSYGSLLKDAKVEGDEVVERWHKGGVALCNLASINLVKWVQLSFKEKSELVANLLRAMDNIIDYGFYPVKEGEYFNKRYRPIGIGVLGLAHLLALNGVSFKDAQEEMFNLMEDVAYHIYLQSSVLAQERGVFEGFEDTKWGDGWLPIDAFGSTFNQLATPAQKERWELLREKTSRGVRFATHIAIAPTNTSALTTGTTEGIEPLIALAPVKEGVYTAVQVAPQLELLRERYDLAFSLYDPTRPAPNEVLLRLASVRQIFIDQAQSINTYNPNVKKSAYHTLKDIELAHKLGLKSLYYLKSKTYSDVKECLSCQS